ncbi:fibronectin type III domain-containing protein, partial [Candidatus Woesebacteria bacterium]|nr:fibronectin type III domain-containing protein [Candidatus Woesebacteria bacterium]
YNRVLTSNEITSLFNNTASAPVTLAPTPTLTPTLISATPVAVTPPPVTLAVSEVQKSASTITFSPKNTTPKDLFANIQNEIDSRIGSLVPSDSNKNLWVQPRGNGTGGWTKNPAVWTGTIDWSGVSPWNNDFIGNTLGYAKAGTLVSPRHVIFANHFRILNGSNILFIDKNGQNITRKIVDYRNIAGTDITVASLDTDVPNTVSFYPVFKKIDLEKYLKDGSADTTLNLPFVLFDKDDHIFVRSTNKNKLFDANATTIIHGTSTVGKRKDFNENVVLGDSGNPGFVIVGGQPVLIFTNFDFTASHSISYFYNQINTAMTSLGGGYQLSTINLTGFTEPTSSVGHPAGTIVQNTVLTTDKTNYKLNDKMQFKAVFTVKPEWVTWMKDSNQAQGSVVFTLTDPDNKVIIQGSNTFVPIATPQTVTFDWNIPDSAILANRTYQLQVNVADSKNAGLLTTKINNIKIDPILPQVDGSIAVTITWPRGVLPGWTKYTHISVTANKKVFCKASKTAGVAYDQMELAFDSRVPLLKPEVSIDGLTPGGAYNYYVKCADIATGEKMTTDVPVTFSVDRITSAPEIRDLEASAVRSTTAEIVWSTTRESTSRVEYSVQGSSNIKVSEDLLPTIPHAQLLLDLTPNTTYTYKVISKDKFNNKVESSSKTFKTKPVAASKVFYISKDGNDANDGLSLGKPFATFERAIVAIKSLGTIPEGGVDVMVRGGTYYRTAPLVLDSTVSGTLNSPVTFKAYNNEKVILSGGASVTGFQTVTSGDQIYNRLDPSAKGNVVKVNLKEKGITNFGILERSGVSKPGGGDIAFLKSHSLQFYFNDNPMTLARWPNTGYSRVDSGQASSSFIPRDDRASRWINIPKNDFWVYGAFGSPFRDSFEKISSITKTSDNKYSIGITAPGPRFGFEVAAPFFYLNILEELDSPGEWYLDRTSGVLYFWPPSNVNSGKAAVSLTSSIVDFKGASNIKFFGFIFENARDSAVNMDTTSSHNMIEKSVIRNSSIGAIIHGRDNGIWGSEVYNIDDDAIMLNGGDPVRLTNGSNYVVNSKIHTYALRNKMYRAGVNMSGGYANDQKTGGVGNRARYNEIYNAPHNAVLVQANNMIVDYNKISNVTRECVDCGAIYAWYQWQQRGNVYRYNVFKSIKDTVGGREGNHQLRNIGVYFDMDVDQSIIYGNIFDDVSTGVLFNGGRDTTIENNIFVNSNEPLYLGVAGMTFGSNTMRNPIVDVSKTTPLVITTQREHNLGRYGEVTEATIEGVEGEPNANGTRKSVTRIDDYRIQLNNTTPAGSYTSGGFFSSNFRFYLFLDEYRYLEPPYSTFYPTLTQRKTEVDDAQPKGNSVKNNILFRNTKQSLTTVHSREVAKKHIPLGVNFNSVDPQFENLAGGDYRLKATSPLLGQGFVNIPVDNIGLIKSDTNPPVVDQNPVPNTKITSNLTITTDKAAYIEGQTIRMTATFTLDPAWVTYLKAKGQTQGEILFTAKAPGSIMEKPFAFTLVNTPITQTHDWVTVTNSSVADKTYIVTAEVHDAELVTKEIKAAPSIFIAAAAKPNTAPV